MPIPLKKNDQTLDQDPLRGIKFETPKRYEDLYFGISQKNTQEEVYSNNLRKVNIPFRFHRYIFVNLPDEKKSDLRVKIKNYFYPFDKVTSIPINRNGFLYIYYEKKLEKDDFDYNYGSEYKLDVYNNESLTYQNETYTKIHPQSGKEHNENKWEVELPAPYINFNEGDIVWVAYSEVRWTNDFRERIMNDFEAVKKRFMQLKVSCFVKQSIKTNLRNKFFLPNHYAGWLKEPEDSPEDNVPYDYNILCGYEKVENLNIYTFCILAAMLFVDDMCNEVAKLNNNFREHMNKISSGINTEGKGACPDPVAYQALFMSASTLFPILLNMSESNRSTLEKKPPIDMIQDEKFRVLLDLNNRTITIDVITLLQEHTLSEMSTGYFKLTLLEYLDNRDINILTGKERIKGYYEKLGGNPRMIDNNVFSYSNNDELKAKQSYDSVEDNRVIRFATQHFFYKDTNEENKYKNLSAATIKYTDINIDFDIIKLLLNTITDENKLFEDRPEKLSITDIYNLMAKVVNNKEESISLSEEMNSMVSIAVRTITFTDSIFWYFTNYVRLTENYKQLQMQLGTIKAVTDDLGIKIVDKEVNLKDKLQQIADRYDKEIEIYEKKAAKAKKKSNRAKEKLGENSSSRKHLDKKEHRAEWTEELSKRKVEELENAKLEKDASLASNKKWGNKLNSKLELDLKSALNKEKTIKLRMETYERESYASVRKITNNPIWSNLVYNLSMAGLLSSIYTTYNDTSNSITQQTGNVIGIGSALTQFIAVAGDRYMTHNAWEKTVGWLNLKNKAMSFSMRFGIGSAIFQAAADSAFAYAEFSKGNSTSGSLYAGSSASLGIAAYCMWISATARIGATATPALPYVSGALMIVSIVTGIAASFYAYDDFENFVAGTVFSNAKEVKKGKFKTSYEMGMKLYEFRKDYSDINYTGLGFTNTDLSKFNQMFDVIRSLFTTLKCDLFAEGDPTPGFDFKMIRYSRFKLRITYSGGIFYEDETQYEVRLYPNGANSKNAEYQLIENLKLSTGKKIDDAGSLLVTFTIGMGTVYRPKGKKAHANINADLVVLVRIKSLDKNFGPSERKEYYPSQQDGEPTYLGLKKKLIDYETDYNRHSQKETSSSLYITTIGELLNS